MLKLDNEDAETPAEAQPAAAGAPRPGAGQMDDAELQGEIQALIKGAQDFVTQELSPERAQATAYYKGDKFGNEEEGRSQVVLTEVRDAVLGVMPSLLRVLFGPEKVVEFRARRAENERQAQQATDTVDYVFTEENPGFMATHAVLKDGLVRRMGIFKWGWEEGSRRAYRLEALDQAQLEILAAEDGLDFTRVEDRGDGLFNADFTRVAEDGCARVWPVPPEEFLFSREARDLVQAPLVAHQTHKTRGELLAMGVSPEDLDAHGGADPALEQSEEELARNPAQTIGTAAEAGEANERILYTEAYPYLDYDGDGVAELRKVCTIGPAHFVVYNKPCDERPFSIFVPDPEPHTIVGQSFADRVMDLQKLKSTLMRCTLDSLAAAIFPRTAYVEGQVNPQDIMNTEIGAPIRVRAPGMIQPVVTPFLGEEAFPILQYLDEVREGRTGQNKGAMGLDADALQSSSANAVGAAVTASQQQTELLARIFVEMAFKPMFRGLLKLLVKHQPRSKAIRLRGEWVEVDPRVWDANMDASVNVALGTGLTTEKIASLMAIAAKQEQILSLLGPSNPLVTVQMYRNTLARIVALQGFKDTESFFAVVPEGWQPPQAGAPAPSPEQVLAQAQLQIEQMRAQRELAIKEAELQMKRDEMRLRDDRERDKHAADIQLRVLELEMKYKQQADRAALDAAIERERMTTQALTDAHATERHAAATEEAARAAAAAEPAPSETTE